MVSVDDAFGFWVPTFCLVAQMDSGFEKFFNSYVHDIL